MDPPEDRKVQMKLVMCLERKTSEAFRTRTFIVDEIKFSKIKCENLTKWSMILTSRERE